MSREILSDNNPTFNNGKIDNEDLNTEPSTSRSENFSEIYQTYYRPIYNYVVSCSGSRIEAEDLTQDIFLKAFKAIDKTSQNLKTFSWLYKIAINRCHDMGRRRKRIEWVPLTNMNENFCEDVHELPEEEVLRKETKDFVQRTLEYLNPLYRTVLVLHYYQELSVEEIGNILGKGESATKSLMQRARKSFKQRYLGLTQQSF